MIQSLQEIISKKAQSELNTKYINVCNKFLTDLKMVGERVDLEIDGKVIFVPSRKIIEAFIYSAYKINAETHVEKETIKFMQSVQQAKVRLEELGEWNYDE